MFLHHLDQYCELFVFKNYCFWYIFDVMLSRNCKIMLYARLLWH